MLDETEKRPAIILGTSSDRIGTPRGRAYYGTFSKDLTHLSGLPMAPYVGIAYGEFDDEFVGIGGLRIRWDTDLSSTHFWDGHNLHHSLDRNFGDGYRVGLLLVDQENTYYMGMSIGLSL